MHHTGVERERGKEGGRPESGGRLVNNVRATPPGRQVAASGRSPTPALRRPPPGPPRRALVLAVCPGHLWIATLLFDQSEFVTHHQWFSGMREYPKCKSVPVDRSPYSDRGLEVTTPPRGRLLGIVGPVSSLSSVLMSAMWIGVRKGGGWGEVCIALRGPLLQKKKGWKKSEKKYTSKFSKRVIASLCGPQEYSHWRPLVLKIWLIR